ncbi:ankyrin repeats (3 copies) [Rhodobiaceae bacterium]|nr:ankyrin repeats (3 copies) [Rhodobiaceae bacterium]
MTVRLERDGCDFTPKQIVVYAFFLTLFVFGASKSAYAAGIQQPTVIIPDTPFIEAVRDGDIDALKAAVVRGESLDSRDKLGSPALFVALQFGQEDAFQFLLENGARIKAKDKAGDTLLTLLAGTKLVHLSAALLEAGADPDRLGASREPAIIIAARAGQAEMVHLLLDWDADYEATDLTGRTALGIAEQRRDRVIENMLREAGAY